jgi:hypothetical protein
MRKIIEYTLVSVDGVFEAHLRAAALSAIRYGLPVVSAQISEKAVVCRGWVRTS